MLTGCLSTCVYGHTVKRKEEKEPISSSVVLLGDSDGLSDSLLPAKARREREIETNAAKKENSPAVSPLRRVSEQEEKEHTHR